MNATERSQSRIRCSGIRMAHMMLTPSQKIGLAVGLFTCLMSCISTCFAQQRSVAVPIVALAIDNTDIPLPTLGIGHFLRQEWGSGSIYALSEGATFAYWKMQGTGFQPDTTNFPCISDARTVYRQGARGLPPEEFARRSLNSYACQNFLSLRLVEAFTTYRSYRREEQHSLPLSNESFFELAASPFKWKYIREPEVFCP